MNYKIEDYELKNGTKGIRILFNDKKYSIISTCFLTDMPGIFSELKEIIDNIFNDKEKKSSITGNIFTLKINKKKTKIINTLETKLLILKKSIVVPTEEFRQLLMEWTIKYTEFKNKTVIGEKL